MNNLTQPLLCAALLSLLARSNFAQGTAFTYQGRLDDGANPANGNYDLRFEIYDAASDGNQQGNTLTNLATAVSNGLFTVTLDFGNQFSGAARWLEIGVRTNGGGAFATLIPRPQITATPYATTAGNVISGGLAAGTYSSAVSFNNPANSFTGNGSGLTSLTASGLAAGTVPDGRLAANVARTNQVWLLAGNAGSAPGTDFLGTKDNKAFEFKVDSKRALRIEPTTTSPNLVGGFSGNYVAAGVVGTTISGGGSLNGSGPVSSNQISGSFSTIGGGAGNLLGSSYAVISGGRNNTNLASLAVIAGGDQHNVGSGAFSAVISGGRGNLASAQYSVISGGSGNSINVFGTTSTIGGGSGNQITDGAATIAGGAVNTAGSAATVAGGKRNNSSGPSTFIGGGTDNQSSGYYAVTCGGEGNLTGGYGAVTGGGIENQTAGGYSFIGGGLRNTNTGQYGSIVGGNFNTVSQDIGTVGGGQYNTNTGYGSTIAGGYGNAAGGTLDSPYAGQLATIGGGYGNTARGLYGTVAGGRENSSMGDFSFTAGRQAKANHLGAFVWADSQGSDFTSSADNEVSFRCAGGVRFTSSSGGTNQAVTWLPGGGGWTFTSDRETKDRITPVNPESVLQKIARLTINEWSYIGYEQRHIGPMAQDFHSQFPLNGDDKSLNDADLHGVALAAIQGLNQKVDSENATLRAENLDLKARLEKLEQLLNYKLNGGGK